MGGQTKCTAFCEPLNHCRGRWSWLWPQASARPLCLQSLSVRCGSGCYPRPGWWMTPVHHPQDTDTPRGTMAGAARSSGLRAPVELVKPERQLGPPGAASRDLHAEYSSLCTLRQSPSVPVLSHHRSHGSSQGSRPGTVLVTLRGQKTAGGMGWSRDQPQPHPLHLTRPPRLGLARFFPASPDSHWSLHT